MSDRLDLLDWRRRVDALYAAVRTRRPDDPRDAHALWRAGRDRLFASHPQSPLEDTTDFAGLPYHDYDDAWAFLARVDTDVAPTRDEVVTSDGQTMTMERCGAVDLPIGRLDLYWMDVYGGGLFLPFRDASSGTTSYGGGRYLLDTVKGADLGSTADGRLVLDFNFAYHPSCRYSPAWSCPLAPPGNRLDVAVVAGERMSESGRTAPGRTLP